MAEPDWNLLLTLEQKIACKSPTSQKQESGLYEDISFLITVVEAVPICIIKYSFLCKFEIDSFCSRRYLNY